ncbi:RHS repeat domain-containing protein [Niveispirillum sp. KHB5.9]|uniref:RHS repeat domain-containing protein n=1 Tax=Niveispirillum sp. KHB5.9 TaxID=3400269 RepID=UPI003A89B415
MNGFVSRLNKQKQSLGIVPATFLGMLLMPTTSMAQLASSNPPPPVIMTDSVGVDLRSGNFVMTSKALGAGAKDDPAIAYAPIDVNYNNDAGTPLIGWIQHYTCGLSDDGCVEYLVARLGNKTITFRRGPGETELTAFTGERLVQDPVLGPVIYDSEDAGWVFDGAFTGSGSGSFVYQTGRLQKIIYKDGRRLTYKYAVNGDMSVDSNLGYQLIVRSAQSNVKLVNTAYDYCEITAASCSFTQTWPTFTRTTSTAGSTTTFTRTDPMSRVTTIASTAITGTNGGTDSDIYHPGGLHQFVRQRSVLLYNQNGQSASVMAVTAYSDDFGSATYSYSGTPAMRGLISHATSVHSDGSQRTYDRTSSQSTLKDELNNATSYAFYTDTMQPWSYDLVDGLLGGVTYPEQSQQSWTYDGRGNMTQSTATPKPGSGQTAVSSSGNYRSSCVYGKTCAIPDYTIDARGARIDYTYHATSGMPLTSTAPANAAGVRAETRYTYQQLQAVYKPSPGGAAVASGLPVWKLTATSTCRTMAGATCVGTADEIRTTYTYNGNLLPVSRTVQSGNGSVSMTVTWDYDIHGNMLWEDGPAAGTTDRTYYFWNANREAIGEVGPDPDGTGPLPYPATRRQFNAEGMVTQIEVGTATAQTLTALNAMSASITDTTTYDKLNRKLTERRSGGAEQRLTQYSYGYKGLLECTAVRLNPATYSSLPASACTLGTAGSDGNDRITRNFYDSAGRLTQVRRAVGTALEQAYVTYAYSANGKITHTFDSKGNHTALFYDGFDRLSQYFFPSTTGPSAFNPANAVTAISTGGAASTTDYEAYLYDANGNRTLLRKRNGNNIGYTYDALNRMTYADYPGTMQDTSLTYDHQGLVRQATSVGGQTIDNVWNSLGQLTSTTAGTRTLSYLYDAAGNRERMTWPDGNYVTTEYDALRRPKVMRENGSTALATFTYDTLGRRSGLSYGNGTNSSYSYTGTGLTASLAHNLPSAGVSFSFTYNAAAQMTGLEVNNNTHAPAQVAAKNSYSANGLNQYGAVNGGAISYDANGNLTGASGWTYGYDALNRLTSASGPGNSSTYAYDPNGRRLSKTVNGVTTSYLYDGPNLVAEYDGSGTLLRRYVFGPGADEPLVQYIGATYVGGSKKYLLRNWQGSIIALADGSGNVAAGDVYKYGPFGESNNPASGSLFRYTGQVYDAETGLYHYKARSYSASLGRFLQTDPVGTQDDLNLYGYVGNDPLNMTDPTGEAKVYVSEKGITIVQTFINNSGKFSDKAIVALGANLSGVTSSGIPVKTILEPGTDADAVTLTTNPNLNDFSEIGTERSHADMIGGRKVELAPNAIAPTVAHEIGHTIGAGDQYKGGIAVDGTELTEYVPGADNLMKNMGGTVNPQSVDEMVSAPTNIIINCPRVSSDGRC